MVQSRASHLLADIVEVEPASEAIVKLKRSGVKIILYDWLFARYESKRGEWNDSHFLIRFEGSLCPALSYDTGVRMSVPQG